MQSQNHVTAGIRTRSRLRRRFLASGVAAAALGALLLSPTPAHAASIFIDPGHGGTFPGAVYGGFTEANINLAFARDLADVLRARGHDVALSRTGDTNTTRSDIPTWSGTDGAMRYAPDGRFDLFDDLQARCDAANRWGADVFVSIHANAALSTSARGAETYWRDASVTDRLLSSRLAGHVQPAYVAATGFADRGVKTNAYYVLRWANMPTILIETGFMSNAEDLRRLTDPRVRAAGARGMADGIERYLATDPYQPREPRIQGPNRYATAAAAALGGWPTGASTVIVASGEQWPDSLAAAPLSQQLDAPIVLASAGGIGPHTAEALATLSPTDVIVLGGEAALPSAVATQAAEAAGVSPDAVERIGGTDRYATAAAIAERVGTSAGQVVIVSGEQFPDAVSASAYATRSGAPILLTRRDAIPPATTRALDTAGSTLTGTVVVGGPAIIDASLVSALEARTPVTWVYGADRYATSLAMVKRYWPSGTVRPYIATGTDFPDALVAGSLAGATGQPVILCGQRYLPANTREWLMNNSARVPSFTMMGGPNAVSYSLEWQLAKAR
ncbi:MAG: N-acetylmuramoyl-L-alanine amidase [Aeromicrobium sp.]|nr:N-acetylmuramoyl-L-alanine amidase [Aeromicrobium sp.]